MESAHPPRISGSRLTRYDLSVVASKKGVLTHRSVGWNVSETELFIIFRECDIWLIFTEAASVEFRRCRTRCTVLANIPFSQTFIVVLGASGVLNVGSCGIGT
jgi:hypothetical protein